MKFTNEQAVEALRAELTNKGRKTLHMSARTLAEQTENLVELLADEEMGLPDFVTKAIKILNTTEGDARKKNSDFEKYKKEHSESDPNDDSDPEPKTKEDPALKAYEERIAALEKRLKDADTKSVLAQKRKDISVKLKEKGVKDDEWLNDFLSEVNITEDLDVDAKSDSWIKLYNKTQANRGKSVPPANPNGDNSSDKVDLGDVSELAKSNNIV